jgi:hypothetical protein
MTRKQFLQQAEQRGMITAGKAAILTGRKPSGKFAAELVKRGIWAETFTDGTKVYSKPEIERKFIRLVKGAAIRPDSEAFINNVLADKQVPLRLETKPKKSEAELLDGIKVGGLVLRPGPVRNSVGFYYLDEFKCSLMPENLIALSREIVRRIDGETVKRPDVQAQIYAALLAYKERIKGIL